MRGVEEHELTAIKVPSDLSWRNARHLHYFLSFGDHRALQIATIIPSLNATSLGFTNLLTSVHQTNYLIRKKKRDPEVWQGGVVIEFLLLSLRHPGSIPTMSDVCMEFVHSPRDFSPGAPVYSHNPKMYNFVG